MNSHTLRTWIEIDRKALRHNVGEFFRMIPETARLMAVIKSNAYGHGLVTTARELADTKPFANRGWFGVDSIVEALRLRREGMANPIFVLGSTLPARMEHAARERISISISSFDALKALSKATARPAIHLKLDTGLHRQGFLDSDINHLITVMRKNRIIPEGVFTHLASAGDAAYSSAQLAHFQQTISRLEAVGFSFPLRHAVATGGTLLYASAHHDMVRIGMGLYGYFPSKESKRSYLIKNKSASGETRVSISLKPALTWKTLIGEIKEISKHSFVGYDLTRRMRRASKIAVVPIGYWHGYDRGFSFRGCMLVRGTRAAVLGRISMDMAVIDVTDIPNVRVGDEAVILGSQKKETISAEDLGEMIGTSAYEIMTRINPLIERIVV